MSRGPLAGIDHQKELHQVVRRGIRALDKEYVTAPNRFVNDRLKFPIRKAQKGGIPKSLPVSLGNPVSKIQSGLTGENLHAVGNLLG
jgi:hypothetical protein